MNAIIDSNILYYLADIEKTPFSREKLTVFLNKFDQINVSELTILELLVKCRGNKNKYIKATNFIVDSRFKVHQVLEDERDTIVKIANDEKVSNTAFFNELCNRGIETKIKIEGPFITHWINSICSLHLMLLFRVYPSLSDKSKRDILAQNQSMVNSLIAKEGYFQKRINEILLSFYFENPKGIANKINDLLLEVLNTYILVFEAAKDEKVLFNIVQGENRSSAEEYINHLSSESTFLKILQRKQKKGKNRLIKGNYLSVYDEVEKSFREKSSDEIDKKLLDYELIVFRKYLTEEGYLIRKNDIFDSIFIKYCNDYCLLTADREFTNRIKIIDQNSYLMIEEMNKECVL
jgi:hypothetical protein